jgi:hypothetical protein
MLVRVLRPGAGSKNKAFPINAETFVMKHAFALLFVLTAMHLYCFAAARYKPAFYDRAIAAIHTPNPEVIEQAQLPPVNLAVEPAGRDRDAWHRQRTPADKAAMGLGLMIAGGVCLVPGIYLSTTYKSDGDLDEVLNNLFLSLLGAILTGAGIGMLIPGIILRMKYGGNRY